MVKKNNNKIQSQSNRFTRFLIIWAGEFLSTIGSGLTAFALGIYAFKMTGQATSATMVTLLTFLPAFLLRPIGGVLADRIDRRILMIFGNLGCALGIGLVFLLISPEVQNLWLVYPGIVLSSVFFAFQNPAYKASVSDFLPKELYVKASGLVQLSGSAQFLIAPLIAGFLMEVVDIKVILIIDIITFVISALNIFLIRRIMNTNTVTTNNEELHFFKEMAEGFKAVVVDRGILILILLVSLVLFYIGLLQALFAPMVLSFTDSRTLG
ncbi:MAG: MFS transporter, partial [Ruminiclostridium sp.]